MRKCILGWAKNPQGFVIMQGPPGVGKTYLMAALYNHMEGLKAKEIEKQGDKPENAWAYFKCYSEFHFLNEIKKCFDYNSGQTAHDRIDTICEAPVLFYDDLGTCKGYEWQQNILQEFINERYNRSDTGTVFTTNLNMSQISDVIDYKSADRLFDTSNALILEFKGSSRRQVGKCAGGSDEQN